MTMTNQQQICRRVVEWELEKAPTRKYLLLLADYYATAWYYSTKYHYLAIQCTPPVDGEFRGLIASIVRHGDGRLTDPNRARALEACDIMQWPVGQDYSHLEKPPALCQMPLDFINDCRLSFRHPRRAAMNLLFRSLNKSWEGEELIAIMDCLRPAGWDYSPTAWVPPVAAVAWAREMYRTWDFKSIPILADMLEDSDCPDRVLLDHCRNHQKHYKGCAAVDRLLGM